MPIHSAGPVAALPPGQMTLADVGGTEVLLCNVDGKITALHPKCTHYGAPLVDGELNGFRLVCPWHHACFDARSGRHVEAPGCDALATYPVEVRGGEAFVTLPEELGDGQRPNPMARPRGQTSGTAPRARARPYLVVGGGPAGAHAVEGIRQGGYTGPVTLVTAEEYLPYDRTQVSKGYLSGDRPAEKMPLRSADFYAELGVDLITGTRVERIDAKGHRAHFAGGGGIDYAKACLATGSSVRTLDVAGADLPAIYSVRTREDAEAIRAAAGDYKSVVVVGSSFIGMESAMALANVGCEVTVVSPEEVPFGKIFGRRVGRAVQAWQEEIGVTFRLGESVAGFEGIRKVTGVKLEGGEVLPASFVVVGIGVSPNSDLVDSLPAGEDGGIPVDEYGYAGYDLYVAGDIASAPQALDGSRARIEHWRVAAQQGTVAGNNMAGVERKLRSVPYFWTNQAGHNLRYAGHHTSTDNVVFDGSPGAGPFIAYYVEGDRVAAALGFGRDKDLVAIHELMWLGAMPSAEALDPGADWSGLLAGAK